MSNIGTDDRYYVSCQLMTVLRRLELCTMDTAVGTTYRLWAEFKKREAAVRALSGRY